MALGAVGETNWRDRSRAGIFGWSVLSLALHLVVTQLPAPFAIGAVSEPTNSTALSATLANEVPVELEAEPKARKSPARAEPVTPVKPAVSKPVTQHEPAPTEAETDRVPAERAPLAAEAGGAGGATGADADASEAGAGGSSSFAELEPSRPGDRLMFDPFRASRGRSSGGIRILIDSARLRSHPLALGAGELLARLGPSDLLGSTGVDPVRDAGRVFIQASSLRDTSGLVMMIQHRSESRLIVAPESVAKSVAGAAPSIALPVLPSPFVVWAHIETPWRAFLGSPIAIPRSLRWLELRIAPDRDGGMTARFEGEAEDEHSAALGARQLAALLADLEPLLSVEFHATGSIIVGACRFTEEQVTDLFERMRSGFVEN